jgi:hypothetical protein
VIADRMVDVEAALIMEASSGVKVETMVVIRVVVSKMTVAAAQAPDSMAVDVCALPEADGNGVVNVPSFVDVVCAAGADGDDMVKVPSLVAVVCAAVDAVGEELMPIARQEQADEMRVGSLWHWETRLGRPVGAVLMAAV